MTLTDKVFMEQMKLKLEKELRERELRTIEYWLGEVQKIYEKRHQQMAEIQVDLQGLAAKMRNRLAALKRGVD